MSVSPVSSVSAAAEIWWSNGTFFVLVHLATIVGVWYRPLSSVSRAILVLAFILFHLGELAITIGYHRLYSHRAFRAKVGVRLLLALAGASAMQGSIKWWCIRHRLHHRYTDDPVHDPYAATRGLLWSHLGWIFYKPRYERIKYIDKSDLDNDPVVRFQHQYYVPLALLCGLTFPLAIGYLLGDAGGAFIWAGLVTRVFIWHCTFFVNSLAHWDGLQPYTDENTSRSNLIIAMLTFGEGNHNFHAFPHDYRSGPSAYDWDPSKWVICLLHGVGLVAGLKRARHNDMKEAKDYMMYKTLGGGEKTRSFWMADSGTESEDDWTGEVWSHAQLNEYVRTKGRAGRCVVVIDGYAVDVTGYLGEHPGGASLLRKYSLRASADRGGDDAATVDGKVIGHWKEASWAFHGGLNIHTRAAKKRMRELRVAKVSGLN